MAANNTKIITITVYDEDTNPILHNPRFVGRGVDYETALSALRSRMTFLDDPDMPGHNCPLNELLPLLADMHYMICIG